MLTDTGHYHAEAWSDQTKSYQDSADVGVFVTVEETFDNNHRIVAQRGSQKGKFTFSAADSGQHRICVVPQNVPSSGSWLSSGVHGTVKFTLDLRHPETSTMDDMVARCRIEFARIAAEDSERGVACHCRSPPSLCE